MSLTEYMTRHAPTQDNRSRSGRVALLSTWNQECGLATYARYLFSEFDHDSFVVLSEQGVRTTRSDEKNVERCWSRNGRDGGLQDFTAIKDAVERHAVSTLHLNIHANFFSYPLFSETLIELRRRGVQVVAQLHNTFSLDGALSSLVQSVDRVLVHTAENRLEAIANGAEPSIVQIVPHGVHQYRSKDSCDREARRSSLGLPVGIPVITAFGFIQPHKGMEALVESVLELKKTGIPSLGLIIGSARDDDANSRAYLLGLHGLVREHGLENDVRFISSYVTDEQVSEYLSVSDLVVMNYRSQYFEASGACSLAVGSGAVVMTSLAPPMMSFGDAVWHMTAGFPPGLSARILLTDTKLRCELISKAREYSEQNCWKNIAARVHEVHGSLSSSVVNLAEEGAAVSSQDVLTRNERGAMRILIQNRPHTFTLRGGDTVVIEKLKAGLEQQGCQVSVDLEGRCSPKDFDLVHLFNFATPELTRAYAERCVQDGVPFVVTTLYEDIPLFHTQSHSVARQLAEYVERTQDRTWLSANWQNPAQVNPSPAFDNSWTASKASALFSNGKAESDALYRDYPTTKKILEVKLGHEVGAPGSAERFLSTYGVNDFVFCVGRFESRKNQLMLLKALEDSDIPVVLAGGGFTYQPEYDRAVRNFVRRGKTLIVDRLDADMLASAYAACKVHVLPSWYELPGLVSLEAASHGRNVVVTRNGTAFDYFGDKAFYCAPGDEESVRNAVCAAYYSPTREGLVACAKSYTWDRCVEETLAAYRDVLGKNATMSRPIGRASEVPVTPAPASIEVHHRPVEPQSAGAVYDMSNDVTEFQEVLEMGELAAKNVDFVEAHRLLEKAEALDPNSVRVLKARGAVFLAESQVERSREYFDRALRIDVNDPKVLSGRGMCDMMSRKPGNAMAYFIRALDVAPDHLVALHQMVECAYALGKFTDLHRVLEKYLSLKPEDHEMRFCLAGCLYKEGYATDALIELKKVLLHKPDHAGSQELRQKIEAEGGSLSRATSPSPKANTAETGHRPLVAGPGLADSLSDLSKMMSEWKVDTRVDQPAVVPTQIVTAEMPQRAPDISHVAPPRSNGMTPSPAVIPIVASSNANESTAVDVAFLEVEDLKRECKFDDASTKLDEVVSRPGLTQEQRARGQAMQGDMMAINGDLIGAEMMYDLVLKETPDFPRALCGKGALAAEKRDWDIARMLFSQARDLDSRYDVPWAGLALCEMADNRAQEAFELFRQAIERNPENHRALLGLIQLGYPLKSFSVIEEALLNFLDLHPVNIDMMYSLAGVYFAQKKLHEAKAEVEKILLFDPQNNRAQELSGMIEDSFAGVPLRAAVQSSAVQ